MSNGKKEFTSTQHGLSSEDGRKNLPLLAFVKTNSMYIYQAWEEPGNLHGNIRLNGFRKCTHSYNNFTLIKHHAGSHKICLYFLILVVLILEFLSVQPYNRFKANICYVYSHCLLLFTFFSIIAICLHLKLHTRLKSTYYSVVIIYL